MVTMSSDFKPDTATEEKIIVPIVPLKDTSISSPIQALSFHPVVVPPDPPILVWRSSLSTVLISSNLKQDGCSTFFVVSIFQVRVSLELPDVEKQQFYQQLWA